ncbi:MAG: DinB family protein [Chloroflexota bacterium]
MHPIFGEYMKLMEALYEGFGKTIEGLPVEALDWTPGPDMNSLAVLIVHTTGATSFLVGEVAGGIPSNRDRAAEFKVTGWDEAKLKTRLSDSLELVRGVLDKLTLDDMTKTHFSELRNRTYVYAEAVFHALDHTGLHVGHAEITRQLWDQRKA